MEEVFLSEDLTSEILIRLPVKAIYRSTSVCKKWEHLISSDLSFKRKLKALPPLISGFLPIEFSEEETAKFYCVSNSDNTAPDRVIDLNLGFLGRPVYIVDSHMGFLLCAVKPSHCCGIRYLVCNPFTRQWVALPKHSHNWRTRNTHLYCYEKEVSNSKPIFHFKVIHCVGLGNYKKNTIEIGIYSSETGQWRFSVILKPGYTFSGLTSTTLIGNSIYFWNRLCTSECVYTYNLQDESFRSNELPCRPSHERGYKNAFFGGSADSVHCVATGVAGIYAWVLVDGIEWSLVHSITSESLKYQVQKCYPAINDILHAEAYLPLERMLVLSRMLVSSGSWMHQVFLYHLDTREIELVNNLKGLSFIPYALSAWFPNVGEPYKERNRHGRWSTLLLSMGCLGKRRNWQTASSL